MSIPLMPGFRLVPDDSHIGESIYDQNRQSLNSLKGVAEGCANTTAALLKGNMPDLLMVSQLANAASILSALANEIACQLEDEG